MQYVSRLLSEDSVVTLIDGRQFKGSEQVTVLILECCKAYNEGYVGAIKSNLTKGVVIGAALLGTVIAINEVIKHKKKKIEA